MEPDDNLMINKVSKAAGAIKSLLGLTLAALSAALRTWRVDYKSKIQKPSGVGLWKLGEKRPKFSDQHHLINQTLSILGTSNLSMCTTKITEQR